MKTMNGFTNELLVKKAKRNWKTRCGAFLLAFLASWFGGEAVYGQAVIRSNTNLGTNIVFDDTPRPNETVPDYTYGGPGTNAAREFDWTGYVNVGGTNGLWLNALSNGFNVNTINTQTQATGTHRLTTNDDLTTNGAATYVTNGDITWGGGWFTVNGTATIEATTGDLNFRDRLVVNTGGTLNLQDSPTGLGYPSGSSVSVNGGTNSGTINIRNIILNHYHLTGSGTLDLGTYGLINAFGPTIDNDINGRYLDSVGQQYNRGKIVSTGSVELNGDLSGNIAVDGGGSFDARGFNSGMTELYVLGNSEFRISNSTSNLTGITNVTLRGNGGLTRNWNVGDLAISNSINVDGLGSLNSRGISVELWRGDADALLDGGQRFTVDGVISGLGTININDKTPGYVGGTVVLTANNTFTGNYVIDRGVLEINGQHNLGTNTNYGQLSVSIGSTNPASQNNRSVFRVVGPMNASETIAHWINLNTQNSYYEVFTQPASGTDMRNLPDADRFKVIQMGQINGSGALNKTGDGTLVLGVNNSFTGDVNIWHGVLSISDVGSLSSGQSAVIRIGGEVLMEEHHFRPVFETTLADGLTSNILTINSGVVVNLTNSTIRTTGLGNTTVLKNTVWTDGGYQSSQGGYTPPYAAILNKDGAGTLSLKGLGKWGRDGSGELKILQGTLEFEDQNNLTSGAITIGTDWNTYKDIERTDVDGNPITYRAVLKLADNSDQGIGNKIILGSPAPGGGDDPASGSYIEVGTGSILGVSGSIVESVSGSHLNKIGQGKLSLNGTDNGYSGWTRVYEGTLATTKANNMLKSAGVDLIGDGTSFDMSTSGASQQLRGLQGIDTVNPNDPELWNRTVLIGDNTLTLNQDAATATLHGSILGSGIFVKAGANGSVFNTGFKDSTSDQMYKGAIDIQTGSVVSYTDAYFTGIAGKAGTYFDIRDNELTLDIGNASTYGGTIISSYPSPLLTWGPQTKRAHLIKDGAGTLTANFYEYNVGDPNSVRGFMGDLTMKQGNIISTSDFHMEGGGELTFYVNPDLTGNVNPLILDVSKHQAVFRQGGASGAENTTVHAYMGNATTGWTTPTGDMTVAKILGNDKSDYSGLVASTTDSLFHSLTLQHLYGTGRHDLHVNISVTGFSGIGGSYNEREVGLNLDRIRVTNLTGNPLGTIIQDLWAAGSNITDEATKLERERMIRGLFQQMSGDTIANATFMGLDKPWQSAFDRLNLDSQMVHLGDGRIANMRNLWFTPTVQSLTMRSDGNARRAGIDRPGYKIGFDKRVAQNASVGFMLGYSTPKLHQGDDRVTASDFQFGVYAGAMVGYYIEMKGFIGFGHQNYKSNRTIYFPNEAVITEPDGTMRAIGGNTRSMTAHGRYDGDTFNFSLEVSRPLFLGFSILRPTIGLDSEHAFRYAFTESGDAIAMKFNRSSLSRTRARFGLSLETTTFDRAIFTGRLGYSALLGGRDYATATGQFVGIAADQQTARSVAVGKSYFDAGVGTRIFLNPYKTLSLIGSYDAHIADRWAEHQGTVGIGYIY